MKLSRAINFYFISFLSLSSSVCLFVSRVFSSFVATEWSDFVWLAHTELALGGSHLFYNHSNCVFCVWSGCLSFRHIKIAEEKNKTRKESWKPSCFFFWCFLLFFWEIHLSSNSKNNNTHNFHIFLLYLNSSARRWTSAVCLHGVGLHSQFFFRFSDTF